jgi:hypothetical protein
MVSRKELAAWMEDRKAEGARSTTLRTPVPPHLTGSDACIQESSSSFMLAMDDSAFLMTSSKRIVPGTELQGEVRSKYSRRGMAKQLLRR